MKITRLKRGYRINVSDSEYEVLNSLIVDGFMTYEGDDGNSPTIGMTPAQKAALTRMLKKSDGSMQILRCIDHDYRREDQGISAALSAKGER